MAKRNNARVEQIDAVPTIVSVRDLGSQFAGHQARGIHFAIKALEFNPDLANDGAKAKTDENLAFWKDLDLGFMSYWEQTHKVYAIRSEDATYTKSDKGTDEDRITAGRAMEGCKEADSPTLHKILKSVKEEVQGFIRDKRRDLRDGVKKHLNQGKVTQRGANKEFLKWLAAEIKKIEDKCKTESNKGEDADLINGVRAWTKSFNGYVGA